MGLKPENRAIHRKHQTLTRPKGNHIAKGTGDLNEAEGPQKPEPHTKSREEDTNDTGRRVMNKLSKAREEYKSPINKGTDCKTQRPKVKGRTPPKEWQKKQKKTSNRRGGPRLKHRQ